MSGLRVAIDHTMLGWIKPELDEVLRQARIELEGFVDDPADTSRMRLCAGYLQQATALQALCAQHGVPLIINDDLELADCIFVAGGNPAWCHPILWRRVEAAREKNPNLKKSTFCLANLQLAFLLSSLRRRSKVLQ